MSQFKKYFLEFLMIFLAVVLGFVAENFREGLGERSKEKEYVQWIVRDFRTDTVILHWNIRKTRATIARVDSLIAALDTADPNQFATRTLYTKLLSEKISPAFYMETIRQLKTSEDAGLIQNSRVADLISKFEYALATKDENERALEQQRQQVIQFSFKIFNNGYDSGGGDGSIFVTKDKLLVNEYLGHLAYYRQSLESMHGQYVFLLPRIEYSIATIAKEYGVSKEQMEQVWEESAKNSEFK